MSVMINVMKSRFQHLAPVCGNLGSIDSMRATRKKTRVRSENTRGKTITNSNGESAPKTLALRTTTLESRRRGDEPRSLILRRVRNAIASHARRNTRWRIATTSRQAAGGRKRSQNAFYLMMIHLAPRSHPQIRRPKTMTSEVVIPRKCPENVPHHHSI